MLSQDCPGQKDAALKRTCPTFFSSHCHNPFKQHAIYLIWQASVSLLSIYCPHATWGILVTPFKEPSKQQSPSPLLCPYTAAQFLPRHFVSPLSNDLIYPFIIKVIFPPLLSSVKTALSHLWAWFNTSAQQSAWPAVTSLCRGWDQSKDSLCCFNTGLSRMMSAGPY